MRTDVTMLGRSVSAIRVASPLNLGIRRASLSVTRDMKRHKTMSSIIHDKQVVVVGGNRGIGLEVRIFPDCLLCSIEIIYAHKAGWQGKMACNQPNLSAMLEQYVRQFLDKGNSVVATARTLAQAAELHKLAKKESKLMLTELDVSDSNSIRVISSLKMHIYHSVPMSGSTHCR